MIHHKSLISAIKNRQFQLFRQSLFRVPLFAEMIYIFTYEELQQIFQYFKILQFQYFDIKQLLTGNIYYILDNTLHFTSQSSKDKLKRTFMGNKRKRRSSQLRIVHISSSMLKAGEYLGIQDVFEGVGKQFGIAYTTTTHGQFILVFNYIDLFNSDEILASKFRNYWQEKTKFLGRFSVLKNMPKNVLHRNLHNFQLLQMHFNEVIYDTNIREMQLFFPYKGEIQIINYNNIQNRKLTIQSIDQSEKNPLNIPPIHISSTACQQKLPYHQHAICSTNQCLIYHISKQSLQQIFEKQNIISQRDKQNDANLRKTPKNQLNKNSCLSMLRNIVENKSYELNERNLSVGGKGKLQGHRRHKFSEAQISSPKKERLREHFSDYLNKKFEEFSEIKMKEIDQESQHPILYQMKVLNRCPPSYQHLNQKLKAIRIRKILQRKSHTLKDSDKIILSITNKNSSQSNPFKQKHLWLDKIQNKIERNLKNQFMMKMKKKMLI